MNAPDTPSVRPSLIPPSWPVPDDDVREALLASYADGSWGRYQGPRHEQLIEALSSFHHGAAVYLCCSGTFAVELALRSAKVEAGQEVLLAGYDFPGNFRAIQAIGATPVLVDVAPWNFQLDPERLEDALGPRVTAIVASHLHGGLVPMRELMEFADRKGLVVIEDACQAPGAIVEGRRAGGWATVGVISFGGSKLLTAGRGGAIFSERPEIIQRAKIHCEQGNHAFPLSELQAAVLLPQLAKLDERNRRRALAAERMKSALADVSEFVFPMNRVEDSTPGYYKLGLRYEGIEVDSSARDEFAWAARAGGVALDPGFRGFANRGVKRSRAVGDLRESRRAADSILTLHHPLLLEDDAAIDAGVAKLRELAGEFANRRRRSKEGGPTYSRPTST